MKAKLFSLLIAASVAVTGLGTAPAQAGDRDIARALAAVAGIAVVGAVIHEAQKDKRRARARHRAHQAKRHHRTHRAKKHHRTHRAKKHNRRHRAHRHGVRDQRHIRRHHRAERRAHRRGHRGQHRYSARPRRHAN